MKKSTLVCEKEGGEREERNDGKEKSFMDEIRKWNGNNTSNEKKKKKEKAADKNSLTFNYQSRREDETTKITW